MTFVATGSVLDRIVADKANDLATDSARRPLGDVRRQAERAPQARAPRFRRVGELAVVAEIKRRSPSKGVLAEAVDPAALALRYAAGGAAMISVLTEQHHFGGSLDDLRAVRAAVDVPVLRKDFLFDPYHLYEARAAGADAALLIVAMLEDGVLRDLIRLAEGLSMTPLVEVHDEAEVERALAAGATTIGINNRNLHTFAVDLAVTERLRPLIPAEHVVVGESGVFVAADARRLAAANVDAILVGEALMRAGVEQVEVMIGELRCA